MAKPGPNWDDPPGRDDAPEPSIELARAQGVAPERLSVIDTIRWLIGTEGDGDIGVLVVNPARVEPRVVKRRPKPYYRMTIPRSELRKKSPMKGF